LRFNLSHSGDGALLAVGWNRELGVDLESVEPARDILALARRYFSQAEIVELDALPEKDRLVGFYNGWARKEAFIKATGDGLGFPLDGFAVRLAPRVPAELLWIRDDPGALARWKLHAVELGAEWSAALVVENPSPREFRLYGAPPMETLLMSPP
jgi:4'-phosphopantetheinyl transferase